MKFNPKVAAAAVAISAAGLFAMFGPTADVDHIASGGTSPDGEAYGSDHEPAVAAPRLPTPDGWIEGPELEAPTSRGCPTTALDGHRPDVASLRSYTAVAGGTATVHLSRGGNPADVVAQIRAAANSCGPQHLDGATIHIIGVYPLAGADGIEIRYGADDPTIAEITSVWIAAGDTLIGATSTGVSDLDWAVMLDTLHAAGRGTTTDTTAGNLAAG